MIAARCVVVLTLTAPVVAGCSASGAPAKTTTVVKTETVTKTAPGPTVTATPTKVAPPSAGYSVGHTFTLPQSYGSGRATVLAYQSRGEGTTGGARQVYRDLKVRVCAANKGTISNGPWSLIGSDGSNNADIVTGGGLHEPQYPSVDDPVTAGECVTGWISFQVPVSVKIVSAKYSLTDPNQTESVEAHWKLAK